jgi:hypothetical protein
MRAALVALAALCCNGCVGLAVWPCVDVTPPVEVGAEDVRAKVCDLRNGWGEFGTLPMTGFDTQSFAEVPVKNGIVDRQVQFREGHFVGFLFGHVCEYHDMKLVLERPGYEPAEVESWPWWFVLGYALPDKVNWKKSTELRESVETDVLHELDSLQPIRVKIGVPAAAIEVEPQRTR